MDRSDKLGQLIQGSQLKIDIIENLKSSEYFEFLNAGNDRVVSKPKGRSVIYKIEENPNQNVKEFKLYNGSKDSLQKRLLPVDEKGENYRWIKCSLAKFNVSEDDKLRFLNSLIKDHGMVPKDFSSDDIGYVNGKIVITDYGYGFRSIKTRIDSVDEIES